MKNACLNLIDFFRLFFFHFSHDHLTSLVTFFAMNEPYYILGEKISRDQLKPEYHIYHLPSSERGEGSRGHLAAQ